ncbi:MAG: hypothetical protein HQK91_15110, partial [Nitrospirae bacterium]|nr:hypothetical protein [Nitrospirota bacterium]
MLKDTDLQKPIFLKILNITFFNIVLIIGLYLMNRYNFLLFHSFIETMCIIVSIGIFIVTLNSIEFQKDDFFLIIGSAYLFVGIFDFIHMLSYKGMNVFTGLDISLSTQLWIMGRYIESLSFLIASLSFYYKVRFKYLITLISIIFIVSLISIFYLHDFPITFIEGMGLTTFKTYSEYLVCIFLGLSIFIISKNRNKFEYKIFQNLRLFVLMAIIGEYIFSSYKDLYSIENIIGHWFKL